MGGELVVDDVLQSRVDHPLGPKHPLQVGDVLAVLVVVQVVQHRAAREEALQPPLRPPHPQRDRPLPLLTQQLTKLAQESATGAILAPEPAQERSHAAEADRPVPARASAYAHHAPSPDHETQSAAYTTPQRRRAPPRGSSTNCPDPLGSSLRKLAGTLARLRLCGDAGNRTAAEYTPALPPGGARTSPLRYRVWPILRSRWSGQGPPAGRRC